MTFESFFIVLQSFPSAIFFYPFVALFIIMLVDMVFDIFESLFADLDLFNVENITGGSLLLPPILSKVPLSIALCISFFVGTVMSFYLDVYVLSQLVSPASVALGVVSLPIVAYLSLLITSVLLKPLAVFFNKKHAFAKIDFIGLTGRVHSTKVSSDSGEVVLVHKGNEVLLDVITLSSEHIEYGDDVVIVSQENESQRYIVAKL